MEIYERIRELRKNHLKMNMEVFGKHLGVSRDIINNIELNRLARPEQKLSLYKLICNEFGVNEEWLLHGIEPMFSQPEVFSLDEFARLHGATELDMEILKAYFELDPEIRKTVLNHFKMRLTEKKNDSGIMDGIPGTPEEFEKKYPPIETSGKIDKTASNL